MPEIGSFVALGDSFTEGLGDPDPAGDGYRPVQRRYADGHPVLDGVPPKRPELLPL
jgi:hypothetical protein